VESAEFIVGSVAVLLGSIGLLSRYLLSRLIRLERESEEHRKADIKTKDEELSKLRLRVADLEERAKRVPILESQVSTLLSEMSTLQQKVRELTEALAESQNREAQLVRENGDLREERDRLRIEKHDLETTKATYERALQLVGVERKLGGAEPSETREPEPERAEEA